ncbi:aminopeptidase P family protein [Pontimonas salivibrio]|uniref:aminopeptidase P family protein n=1 Tax=Pontimonas salivibrio TaxID=1159327 RepID=UPI000CF31DE9|nr:aminopeptidase P family protein [Pontimonas salivibrio]
MSDSTKKPPRSRTPESAAFREFISSGWEDHPRRVATRDEVADFTATRRALFVDSLPEELSGHTLVIPAGPESRRSNDTDYPYRPHSAFTHLTGWGSDTVPGSVLVITPGTSPATTVLYARGSAGRDTDEFYANAAIGEFWTGPRPHLDDIASRLGLQVQPLDAWSEVGDQDLPHTVVLPEADDLFSVRLQHRRTAVLGEQQAGVLAEADHILARHLAELRFVKDDYEVDQMRLAIGATHRGFNNIIGSLPDAAQSPRGERVVESAFAARARLEGNDVGYGTIAASGPHACILHWVRNDGPVGSDDLLLVDAGVELDSLYTADITRTLPVSGRFSARQRQVYDAVLEAADQAFAAVRPGVPFRAIHDAAMEVIAAHTARWGFLPGSADESLKKDAGWHRRYMIHGTSHHLGLDVHDCQKARRELYVDQELRPGMVFTIEPGLYFQPDDLTVPAEWRGIGVRIEDNILVTKDGAINLSADIPRTAEDVEAWVKRHTP